MGSRLRQARNGSLGRVFDHVGIAVSDLAASERFYRTVLSVLGVEPSHADAELVEWDDWDIGPTDPEHPVTRGLHVGFRARDRAQVDAFWQAGVDAGYQDDGAPGPRTQYGPTYYGGFLLDPDGNSVEAVHRDRQDAVPDGRVDHLWIRVRDPQASRRFYTTIAPHAGLRLAHDDPGRVQLCGRDYSFSLVRDERPLTEHVHLAFPAREDATVRAFHAAALAAGYEDNGAPGERAVYHPGYYGAFVLDPDGHNVEVVSQPGLSAERRDRPCSRLRRRDHSAGCRGRGRTRCHWPVLGQATWNAAVGSRTVASCSSTSPGVLASCAGGDAAAARGGVVSVACVGGHVLFPARFQVVGTASL